jgi:hypothetical protein
VTSGSFLSSYFTIYGNTLLDYTVLLQEETRKGLCSKRRISPYIFHVVASLSTKACYYGTTLAQTFKVIAREDRGFGKINLEAIFSHVVKL